MEKSEASAAISVRRLSPNFFLASEFRFYDFHDFMFIG